MKTSGNIHKLARQVRDTLVADPDQVTLTASADRGAVAEGRPVTVTVAFTNRNGFGPATDVTLSLDAPEGMTAEPSGTTTTASVAPGETFSAIFTVTLTQATGALISRVPVGASYRAGGTRGAASASVRLMAGTGVGEAYRTTSFNDAVFGQSGDAIAIEGAGADLWSSTNEFGTVYRAAAFTSPSTATVQVTSQDTTGGWARAGLIVRNDLSENGGSGGYVNLAVTPSNGCALSWDSDGNGRFDAIELAGSLAAPVYLRLTRSGDTYTGECSRDGVTWTKVGIATPGGVAGTQDIGVFMTAANGWTGTRGIAGFEDFAVS